MAQSGYIIQVSPLPGKWDKIIHKGSILQIQVQNSNNSNNVVIYASGDAQFVSDMVAQNKPLIEASDGTKYYELSSNASKINITLSSEAPPKTEGKIWQSKGSWDNGITRLIENEGFDPQDKLFLVKQMSDKWEKDKDKNEDAGEFKGYLKILGNGEAEFSVAEGRFYVFKNEQTTDFNLNQERDLWSPNLEASCDIKIDDLNYPREKRKFINFGGCTNHFTDVESNSNGRNYSIEIKLEDPKVRFKKETIHGVYDTPDETEKKIEFPLGKYVNLKFRQRVLNDNSIELEGWIDGNYIGKYVDSGQMTDFNGAKPEQKTKLEAVEKEDKGCLCYPLKSKTQIWAVGAYSGLYIRINRVKKGYIRNLTVKEI